MENRENGLLEIYERIKDKRVALGLATFKRTPTEPIREENMPCIFMIEGIDNIVQHSKRSAHGYPARRVLEVSIELVAGKGTNIKQLYSEVRKAIFAKRGVIDPVYDPVIAENTFINENRSEGPLGYGEPDVVGMRLVLDLVYTDKGL